MVFEIITENLVLLLTGWTMTLVGIELYDIGNGYVSVHNIFSSSNGNDFVGRLKAPFYIFLDL
jgi:hypothetical protein